MQTSSLLLPCHHTSCCRHSMVDHCPALHLQRPIVSMAAAWHPLRQPRPAGRTSTTCSARRDLSAGVLEAVASMALRLRLKECRDVRTEVSCDAFSLMAGRINSVRIVGEGWRSPLNLTAQLLECQVGEARIDYGAVIQRQQIVLANMPEGSARVVFSDADFGHFLQHPLMQAAASTAVGGQAFVFEQSVRVERMSQHAPMGVVEMAGVWRGDGRRYAVRLMPAGMAGAAGVAGGAAGAAGAQQQGRAVGSRDAGVSGVIVRAAPAEAAARTDTAEMVGQGLSDFFNRLTIDLQGAEMSFRRMCIVGGAGFAGGLVELHLRLVVREFPPLDVQF